MTSRFERRLKADELFNRILVAKQRDAGADAGLRSEATASQVSALACRAEAVVAQAEAEIDGLVYALYGLTKDEIKIIEENCQGTDS